MSILKSIRRDIEAARQRDPAAVSTIEVVLAYPGFHARQIHRVAHALHKRSVPVLPRLISHFGRWATGIEIHPGASIGEGLFIDHGMGVVIGETAEIGDDVTLYQGVTLGGVSLDRVKRHPTLHSGAIVGAGAQVLGPVEIGSRARVGAGSVVVESVPPETTVVGVPAKPRGERTILSHEVDRLHLTVRVLEERLRSLEARLQEVEREFPVAAGSRR